MTVITKTLQAALVLGLGFGAGYAARSRRVEGQGAVSDAWLVGAPATLHGTGGAISYTDDAVLKADVQLPTIETIDAKIKFVIGSSETTSQTRSVGYVANVRIATLDKEHLPARYRTDRTESSKAGAITIPALEQVVYSAQFVFDLLDKDGFMVSKATGPEHWIESGKTNSFQDIASPAVDLASIDRVASFRVHMTVLHCLSCQ